ncbi:hypothetical protein JW964_22880 [candidate division KSB1 bacterium]|nr:hypothetical protein [candidate division KSB1 bacterium]
MNLKNASLYLIIGILYTIFHKVVYAIFPSLNQYDAINQFMAIVWLVATFTIILFACYFLKEIPSLPQKMKVALIGIIVFTGIILLTKLPFQFFDNFEINRTLFRDARILNAISFLLFLIYFHHLLVTDIYSLKKYIRIILWCSGLSILLQLIGLILYIKFRFTGVETEAPAFLSVITFLVFIVGSYFSLLFLMKFRKVDDYHQIK